MRSKGDVQRLLFIFKCVFYFCLFSSFILDLLYHTHVIAKATAAFIFKLLLNLTYLRYWAKLTWLAYFCISVSSLTLLVLVFLFLIISILSTVNWYYSLDTKVKMGPILGTLIKNLCKKSIFVNKKSKFLFNLALWFYFILF